MKLISNSMNKWWVKVDGADAARDMCKQGTYGALAYAVFNIIGFIVIYTTQQRVTDGTMLSSGDVEASMFGIAASLPLILFMAYRINKGRGWLSAAILAAMFVFDAVAKVVGGTTNIFWVIFYSCCIFMLVNGVRGCWYLRKQTK